MPGNSANVQVTGSIPLNQEFQDDWGLPSQLIMPNDWALWAHTMATTDQYLGSLDPSAYWDIHDSSGPLGNESPTVRLTSMSTWARVQVAPWMPFVDQVDDCTGNEGLYSRIFGDLTTGETGPFDQSYSSTLLSDGRLNSSDAPMPALKIVYNSSGGMGGFANSCLNDKDNVYNRNVRPDEPRSERRRAGRVVLAVSTASSTERLRTMHTRCTRRTTASTSRRPLGIRWERRLESMVRSTPSTPDSPTTSPASAGMGSTRTGRSPTSSSRTSPATPPVVSATTRSREVHVAAEQRLPDSRDHLHG